MLISHNSKLDRKIITSEFLIPNKLEPIQWDTSCLKFKNEKFEDRSLNDVASDQPDPETCALKCHYLDKSEL